MRKKYFRIYIVGTVVLSILCLGLLVTINLLGY